MLGLELTGMRGSRYNQIAELQQDLRGTPYWCLPKGVWQYVWISPHCLLRQDPFSARSQNVSAVASQMFVHHRRHVAIVRYYLAKREYIF
jgi:hypothetical protein